MRKTIKKVHNFSHNSNELYNSESSSFVMGDKALYLKLITILKNIEIQEIPSLIANAEELFAINSNLNDEYSNKYINAIYENNELYNLYKNSVEANIEILNKKLNKTELDLQKGYELINEDLIRTQQESINRYKDQENIFLPKTKNLENNKKTHKDELYRITREINRGRIESNHRYDSIANDISSKNEQEQLKFNHSIESSIEKNTYDKSVITQDALDKIEQIFNEIENFDLCQRQIISTKEKQIAQNTIKLNNIITQLGIDYENRLKYAYIPYEIKSNKLLDELTENEKTYNLIEEKVLTEFKTLLQENDNEIEVLRESHKEVLAKYLSDLKKLKKEFNSSLQKEINRIDKQISTAASSQNATNKKETNELIKKLVAEKKEIIRKLNKLKYSKIKELKEKHLEYELDYIEKYEQLRSKKSECEAIKSSAMKNVNYERVYHHERINSELKIVNTEKESFTTQDHYEETKDIYSKRLNFDIENESIRYEINEIENKIFEEKITAKYNKDKVETEKEYNLSLCDADLEYQKSSIQSRIDYFNVKVMLDIKKENIINEFEKQFAAEKIDFEKIKYAYYNSCDNIQYQIYKSNNDLACKLIDEDVKYHQDLAEIERTHKLAKHNQLRNLLVNQNQHQENLLQIKLYEDRLEVEKTMLLDLYDTYHKLMENVLHFEADFHDLVCNLRQSSYEKYKKDILIALELVRQIKLNILKNYYEKEILIINTRLNFEKSIKFNIQIENTKKELEATLGHTNSKIEKTDQRITSHKNTLLLSVETIKSLRINVRELTKEKITKKHTKNELLEIKAEITKCKEHITLLKKQMKANALNIRKLNNLRKRLVEELAKKENMYKFRFAKINRAQANEEKTYNYLTDLVERQYQKIRNNLVYCGQVVSVYKYTYDNKVLGKNKIIQTNHEMLEQSENYFDIHLARFDDLFKKQYNLQKDIYVKNFARYCKELKRTANNEYKEYQTNITTATNAHNATVDTLTRQATYSENKLLMELKKINDQQTAALKAHHLKMKELSDKKEFELLCHEENCQMHLANYNEKNSNIINTYLAKIKEIKTKYQQALSTLESKYVQALKRCKAQHASNILLMKNNIININNEYKENTKKADTKISKIVTDEKIAKVRHEENTKIRYKLYLLNQKNTRKEFSIQTNQIAQKCTARINALKKSFKKEFMQKKD